MSYQVGRFVVKEVLTAGVTGSLSASSSEYDSAGELQDVVLEPKKMAGTIGSIGEFDDSTEQWTAYTERFEYIVEANGIDDSKWVATFLSVISAKTFNLLRSLSHPARPGTKTYAEIVTLLNGHHQNCWS